MLDFIRELARDAGDQIRQWRREGVADSTRYKNGDELVTRADIQVEKLITDRIHAAFPAHRMLAEESAPDSVGLSRDTGPLWIIDPIDGTVNFAHDHFQVAVSIAFADQGELQAAVVYNPFLDELYEARRGGGARCNGLPIRPSEKKELRRALVATGFPYTKEAMEPLLVRVSHVLRQCADLRRLGSAAMDICWVARGRLDAYYENLSVWDFAGAQLIAREAGACYGHFQPVPDGVSPVFHDRNILVTNPALFEAMRALLQEADRQYERDRPYSGS